MGKSWEFEVVHKKFNIDDVKMIVWFDRNQYISTEARYVQISQRACWNELLKYWLDIVWMWQKLCSCRRYAPLGSVAGALEFHMLQPSQRTSFDKTTPFKTNRESCNMYSFKNVLFQINAVLFNVLFKQYWKNIYVVVSTKILSSIAFWHW